MTAEIISSLHSKLNTTADPVSRADIYYRIALAEGKSEYNARVVEYLKLVDMLGYELNAANQVRIRRRMKEIETLVAGIR